MIPLHLFVYAFILSIYDSFTVKSVVDKFNKYARCDIFVGKTGSGKTMCGIHLVRKIKRVFKDIIVISNIESPLVDLPLTMGNVLHIYDKPVVVLVDEANSTFASKLKSDVPEDLVKFLMQTRKGAGKWVILLTQDYSLLDTKFRKLAHYVYDCHTFFGRLTRFRRFSQQDYEYYYAAGGVNTMVRVGKSAPKIKRVSDWFVQDQKIRSLYDYKAIVKTDWHINYDVSSSAEGSGRL